MAYKLKDIVEKAYQSARDFAVKSYPHVKAAAIDIGNKVKDASIKAYDGAQQHMGDVKDFEKYVQRVQTGPQRLQERLDQLTQEGRTPAPILDMIVGIAGQTVTTQEIRPGTLVYIDDPNTNRSVRVIQTGYLIDPVSRKLKRYTITER